MKFFLQFLWLSLLVFSSYCHAFPVSFDEKTGREVKQRDNNLQVSSAQQAAQLVKNRFGGKVLKVQGSKVNGHEGYKVKLLKADGNIISVLVDAQSGRIEGN